MTARAFVTTAVVAAVLASVLACGEKAELAADPAPFQAAVTAYLAAHSMDMAVASFESLSVEGDAATALCRMEEKSGLYGGVAVRWRFTFARQPDGSWRVLTHEQAK